MNYIKNILFLCCFGSTLSVAAQHQWMGKLSLTDLDCEQQQACYTLSIKGVEAATWALGDQNYRLFFDASQASIQSVNPLLPENYYSHPQVNEVLEIVGQGQEAFSPLDEIDSHLGFLDFSIIAYNKQSPNLVSQITLRDYTGVAEICLEVADELLEESNEENALHLYFSRPETAGQITNQFAVISAISAPNKTVTTQAVAFVDVNVELGMDAQLAEVCELLSSSSTILNQTHMNLYPNPYLLGKSLNYETNLSLDGEHNVLLYDVKGKLIKTYQNLPAQNRAIQLPVNLASGIYFFHLKTKKHHLTDVLVVEQK